jgi:hypothetical protein
VHFLGAYGDRLIATPAHDCDEGAFHPSTNNRAVHDERQIAWILLWYANVADREL